MLQNSLIKIYRHNEKNDWELFCKKYNLKLDIYYQADFLYLDAILQKGEYEIFTFEKGENIFIYPYIKLPIPLSGFENYFDISSPYGYAGPYVNNTDEDFFNDAEKSLIEYYNQIGIITEFVRYHYLYNEERFFNVKIQNSINRTIVIVNLNKGADYICREEFSPPCRNIYRKMEKENYVFEFCEKEEDVQLFWKMYAQTMDNASADSFYYFGEQFIKKAMKTLGDKLKLTRVMKDGVTYASSLFYFSNGIITYYLLGRNLDYPKVRANSYLLSKIILWASDNNYNLFNLGGGTDNNPDNSLFEFKKKFSGSTAPFYIGKRIHREDIYEDIKKTYIAIYGQELYDTKKQILQFYR